MDLTFIPVSPQVSADPYADWHPERSLYVTCGAHALDMIAALERHVGGPLTVQRLRMLASMKRVELPEGAFCYEAAAIRKLKGSPSRGCPPHIRDRLSRRLVAIWPSQLAFPDLQRPATTKGAA